MSLDTARKSDVVEKVFAHRSSKKASAFSCPTRDRIDAVDHFISPKVGPKSLLWDFFNNVTSACATTSMRFDVQKLCVGCRPASSEAAHASLLASSTLESRRCECAVSASWVELQEDRARAANR